MSINSVTRYPNACSVTKEQLIQQALKLDAEQHNICTSATQQQKVSKTRCLKLARQVFHEMYADTLKKVLAESGPIDEALVQVLVSNKDQDVIEALYNALVLAHEETPQGSVQK